MPSSIIGDAQTGAQDNGEGHQYDHKSDITEGDHSDRNLEIVHIDHSDANVEETEAEPNDIHKWIKSKYRGIQNIPTRNLRLGAEFGDYGIRKLKIAHVHHLAQFMESDYVLNSVITVNKGRDGDMIVIDGNHRVKAIREIQEDIDPDAFHTVPANVYENLSIHEAKCVAFGRNQNDARSMEMTVVEQIDMIRSYMAEKPMEDNNKEKDYYFDLYKALNIGFVKDSGKRRRKADLQQRSAEEIAYEEECKKKRADLQPMIQLAKWPHEWWNKVSSILEKGVCKVSAFKDMRGWQDELKWKRLETFLETGELSVLRNSTYKTKEYDFLSEPESPSSIQPPPTQNLGKKKRKRSDPDVGGHSKPDCTPQKKKRMSAAQCQREISILNDQLEIKDQELIKSKARIKELESDLRALNKRKGDKIVLENKITKPLGERTGKKRAGRPSNAIKKKNAASPLKDAMVSTPQKARVPSEQSSENDLLSDEEFDFKMHPSCYVLGDIVAIECKYKGTKEAENHLGRVLTIKKSNLEVEWLTDTGTDMCPRTLVVAKLQNYKTKWNGQKPIPKKMLQQVKSFKKNNYY